MRATSIAYLDSLACQKHLFSSLAATVLEKTVNTLKHVRNVTNSVTVVTSSALYASLNKHLLNKALPQHKVILDVVPANATFFEACGAIKAHLSHANYFVWRPISPFITPNVVEHCVHNVLANKGQLSLPVREFDGFSDFQSGAVRLTQSGHWTKQFIVPIGGGKDSVVTLELLDEISNIRPFIMNPRGATLECARVAGYGNDEFIEVNRRIDPLLLELNANGFLNGHTPFSAMLAFYSLLVSAISGHRHIALSNESSANEPTVAGTDINHQYSKSFAFESDFRSYVKEYISGDFNYFSFLRPLNELQIARLFSRQEKYFPVFKSCNAGSKTDVWCCNCPKCLFAFTILSPFIPMNELTRIFGKNIFELPQMLTFLKELTGIAEVKPFECVGTIDEVNVALQLVIAQSNEKKLPLLLEYYSNSGASNSSDLVLPNKVLNEFNDSHFLEDNFLEILKQKLK